MRFMLLGSTHLRVMRPAIFLQALNILTDFTIRRLEYYTRGSFLISNNAETFIHRDVAQTFFPDFTARIMRFTLLLAARRSLPRVSLAEQYFSSGSMCVPGFCDSLFLFLPHHMWL